MQINSVLIFMLSWCGHTTTTKKKNQFLLPKCWIANSIIYHITSSLPWKLYSLHMHIKYEDIFYALPLYLNFFFMEANNRRYLTIAVPIWDATLILHYYFFTKMNQKLKNKIGSIYLSFIFLWTKKWFTINAYLCSCTLLYHKVAPCHAIEVSSRKSHK